MIKPHESLMNSRLKKSWINLIESILGMYATFKPVYFAFISHCWLMKMMQMACILMVIIIYGFGEIIDRGRSCFQSWLLTGVLNIPNNQKTQSRSRTHVEPKLWLQPITSWRRVSTIPFLTSLNYTLRREMLIII